MSDTGFSDVIKAVKLFEDYDRPWAVCGGWAIDLYIDRVTRSHKDVDFMILRKDQLVIHEHLSLRGWTLEKAFGGQLAPWQIGEWIDLPIHIIWCKNPKASPDFVELLFNEVDDVNFLFRRDTSITLPFEKMILSSASDIPILAPEIVLLYKSANADDLSYTADFKKILPSLTMESCNWLRTSLKKLHPDHTWLKDLQDVGKG